MNVLHYTDPFLAMDRIIGLSIRIISTLTELLRNALLAQTSSSVHDLSSKHRQTQPRLKAAPALTPVPPPDTPPKVPKPTRYGLEWKQSMWELEPRWTIEPDIADMQAVVKEELGSAEDCEVTFLDQGAFNKIYRVSCGTHAFILRISLPVDPFYKTESEVATLRFMREYGRIPVPAVKAFNSCATNPIGFEWILMELMPGVSLQDRWPELSWTAKERIVEQLASYYSTMSRYALNGIGNIYPEWRQSDLSAPEVSRIVSMPFFWGDHVMHPIPRGPFKSSHDWVAARLSLYEEDAKQMLQAKDQERHDDAKRSLSIVNRLQKLLPRVFPKGPKGHEVETILLHNDLNLSNILVDEDGQLTAILDWEAVTAVPLWKAYDFPKALDGPRREEKPLPENYGNDEDGELTAIYWEDLEEYEMTMLRQVFRTEAARLIPGWVKTYWASQPQRDFDFAIDNFDDLLVRRSVLTWIDEMEAGGSVSNLTNPD